MLFRSDFQKCAESLCNRRLIKQNLESTQLLDIMFDIPTKSGKPKTGWLNHPALIAWRNTPGALIAYTTYTVLESKKRGFKVDYYIQKLDDYKKFTTSLRNPVWLGDEKIHSSHRVRLLQKGWEEKLKNQKTADATISWYNSFDWEEMYLDNFFEEEYYWPINIGESYDLEIRVSKQAAQNKKLLIETYGKNPLEML